MNEAVGGGFAITVHHHVCISVPFALLAIAETFQMPGAALVFVYAVDVTL